MPSNVKVNFQTERVIRAVEGATRRMVAQYVFAVEAQAKVNATENGQVDTGFMRNAIYAKVEDRSNFDRTDPTGVYADRGGNAAPRVRVPEAGLGDAVGLVHCAADYAIYQEMENPFLYKAAEEVARMFPQLVRGVSLGG